MCSVVNSDWGENEMCFKGMWANGERSLLQRYKLSRGRSVSPLVSCPSFRCIVLGLPFKLVYCRGLKSTIVGGLPSEKIWDALITLECLQPGFEVGRRGGLPDPTGWGELYSSSDHPWNVSPSLFPPFQPPALISLHPSTRPPSFRHFSSNPASWLDLYIGTHSGLPLSLPSASLHHLLYLHLYLKVLINCTLGFVPRAAAGPGINYILCSNQCCTSLCSFNALPDNHYPIVLLLELYLSLWSW